LLNQADPQSAHRGVTRNAGTDDAAADDQQIQFLGRQFLNVLEAPGSD